MCRRRELGVDSKGAWGHQERQREGGRGCGMDKEAKDMDGGEGERAAKGGMQLQGESERKQRKH